MEIINLLNLNFEELKSFITNLGEREFRAKQLFEWIYKKKKFDFDQMTNLPLTVRKILAAKADVFLPRLLKKQVSRIDGTTKYLTELTDGEKIETVYIPHSNEKKDIKRRTLCISTQVGCPIGCSFCATGLSGYVRNLEVSEIIGQVLAVKKEEGFKITNVVFMGMGEPLLNYDNVLKSINILTCREGLDLSARRITVSTSGIVPKIRKLALENIPLVLAISLHSPRNEIRDILVPINKKYPLEELISACKYFVQMTNRKVTFEYALLKGINDSSRDAERLGELLHGLLCNVNLIPMNKVEGSKYIRPSKEEIIKFKNELEKRRINCVIRSEKGSDIAAACGQLRRKENG